MHLQGGVEKGPVGSAMSATHIFSRAARVGRIYFVLAVASAAIFASAESVIAEKSLLGRLIHNPDSSGDQPAYALTDKAGTIRRYVESEPGIDLESSVGQIVAVQSQHTSSRTLRASQLDLSSRTAKGKKLRLAPPVLTAAHQDSKLQQVQHEKAITPDLAAPAPSENLPLPQDERPLYLEGPHNADASWDECSQCGPEGSGRYCSDCCQEGSSSYCSTGSCCSTGGCSNGCGPRRYRSYGRVEYLAWWFAGMDIPALVVRGDPVDPDPNVDGDETINNAFVVYGNESILDGRRNGLRIRLGFWLDECGQLAIEGDYFNFRTVSSTFQDSGFSGDTGAIGRPFFDINNGAADAVQLVYFPDVLEGSVTVRASSRFESAGIRFRENLCCFESCGGCGCGDCVGCGDVVGGCGSDCGPGCGDTCGGGGFGRRSQRFDLLLGLRYARLNERLSIDEDLRTIEDNGGTPTTFLVNDTFRTDNVFFGGELGFLMEWVADQWSLEVLSKLAIGSTRQRVTIDGSTIIDGGTPLVGGLLAQTSNIGRYSRNELSVMPELGFTAGYQLSDQLKLTAGYTFLYWSSVVRPGDQIDLDVNSDLVPGENAPTTTTGADRPRFAFRDTDLWAHGINLGVEYQW